MQVLRYGGMDENHRLRSYESQIHCRLRPARHNICIYIYNIIQASQHRFFPSHHDQTVESMCKSWDLSQGDPSPSWGQHEDKQIQNQTEYIYIISIHQCCSCKRSPACLLRRRWFNFDSNRSGSSTGSPSQIRLASPSFTP